MGQFTSKTNALGPGALRRVRFSTNEEGPPRYSSHHFDGNARQGDGQIPPTIVVSDEESRFVSNFTFKKLPKVLFQSHLGPSHVFLGY